MRVLTGILLLASCFCCQASGFLVFGDSQSILVADTKDARHAWPSILQQITGQTFQNLSQGGRMLSDGHVASYLRIMDIRKRNRGPDGIIIALGTLDGVFGMDYKPAMRDAIDEATARGFSVICILPPDNRIMRNDVLRSEISGLCPKSLTVDVGPIDMVDRLHFGHAGHAKYAKSLYQGLTVD